MLARTYTATTIGLDPLKIEIEVDGSRGIPHLIFIGLTSKATEEAKERITAALQNCDIRMRSKRTIVNLAPAEVPKTGASFDLAIAIGLLKMYQEIDVETDDTMFFGELSLDGNIKSIRGTLPLVLAARSLGFKHVVIPKANQAEVATISGINIHPIAHLKEYLATVASDHRLPTIKPIAFTEYQAKYHELDFAEVKGQDHAKRALMIAAAGGHHVLLNGSPGSGKSMLAQAFRSILPPLTEAEAIEVTTLYSLNGFELNGLIRARPFRSPHHTATPVGLLGGGNPIRPGEISLAHRGVLFLDELLEFNPVVLDTLRQPLESQKITVIRAWGRVTYPAVFSLIAATNPCPCGYHYSQKRKCDCSPGQVDLYSKRLSGPLLDRFDLRVRIRELETQELTTNEVSGVSSAELRAAVTAARTRQHLRFHSLGHITNAQLTPSQIKTYCPISAAARRLLAQATTNLNLSARGYFKVIKVAQTIADLANSTQIEEPHIAEALQYR